MKKAGCAISLLMAAAMAASALAGCQNADSSGTPSSANPSAVSTGDQGGSPEGGGFGENFNETGLPIVKEKESFRVMTSASAVSKKTMNEKTIFDDFEAATNVHIEWEEVVSSGWTEKINLAINSGDLPDATFASSPNMADAVSSGLVVAWDDYLDIAPNIQKILETVPEADISSRFITDGKLYSCPGVEPKPFASCRAPLFINKTWLDKLGLQVPKTTEEFRTILEAFKTGDPNGNGAADEIPLGVGTYFDGYEIYDFMGAWDIMAVKSPAQFTVRDGKLDFNPVNPNFRKALEYFHGLYKDGLMDPEAMTQDLNTRQAKNKGATAVYGAFIDFQLASSAGSHSGEYIAIDPLAGPDGVQKWPYNPSVLQVNTGLVIFKNCKSPEVLVRWMDYLNEGLNPHILYAGNQGVAWDIDKDTQEFYTIEDNLPGGYDEYRCATRSHTNTIPQD